MKLTVVIAQTRVSWDIARNLAAISAALAGTRSGEVVLLPEAAVSGYDDSLSGLARLDPASVTAAVDRLAAQACERGIHLVCGSLVHEYGSWRNAALYLAPDGARQIYRKVNLATHERGQLSAGSVLPLFRLELPGLLRAVIDTADVANWYLDQRREDVLALRYRGAAGS